MKLGIGVGHKKGGWLKHSVPTRTVSQYSNFYKHSVPTGTDLPGKWVTQRGRKELCQMIIPLLKIQIGVFRIGTFVDAENVASAKVLQKCGLLEEARLTKWFRFVNQNNEAKDCILFKLP